MKRTIAFAIAFAVTGLAGLIAADEAQACSPAPEMVSWTIPDDGQVVSPNTTVTLIIGGLLHDERDITVTHESGDEIDGEVISDTMAFLFSGYREFIPDEPLDDGEYTVEIGLEETNEEFEMTFEVDSMMAALPAPESVEFQWFRETHDENKGDSCYWNDEFNGIAIEPLAVEPDYYEVILTHSDDSATIQLLQPERVDGSLTLYEIGDVECVSVAAGMRDGTYGGMTETCAPDKCLHYDDDTHGWYRTEWDEIDGCDDEAGSENGGEGSENGGEGSENGGEGSNSGENGSENGGEESNDDEDDHEFGGFEDDDETAEDESESSCAAAAGAPTSLLVIVFALGLATLTRRVPTLGAFPSASLPR